MATVLMAYGGKENGEKTPANGTESTGKVTPAEDNKNDTKPEDKDNAKESEVTKEPETTKEPEATPTPEPAPEPSFDPEAAFDGLGVFQHGNIVLTGWELKAGMVLGLEDFDPAINTYLGENGGLVNIVFLSETEVIFTNGTESLNGTYEYTTDSILHLTFDGREFYAGYAITEFDWDVLWVIDMENTENLYPFIYIDEH